MKLLFYIVLCAGLSGLAPPHSPVARKYEKKINKMLNKIWDQNTVTIEEVMLPDSPNGIPGRSFYSLIRGKEKVGILSINKAHGCQIGGCDGGRADKNARYEDFWYAAIFDTDLRIVSVKVLDYQSDYGYEICSKNWLRQFRGVKGCDLEYGSKKVDGISGATVSGRSIVADINNLCWLLHDLRETLE